MPTKHKKHYTHLRIRKLHLHILLDRILFFRYIRLLHGRFWGITGLAVMCIGFFICFFIRPDLVDITTAFSVFGNDVRTAPYFVGAVFFAAYGLWRWRNYLRRTLKRPRPMLDLIALTIVGLYLVALMPLSWRPVPYFIHVAGMTLVGLSMAATVIVDGLLSKTRRTSNLRQWQFIRLLSFMCIVAGGWFTFGSLEFIAWFHVSLLGETMMLFGYTVWIFIKTYQGEGQRSFLSHMLKRFVFID